MSMRPVRDVVWSPAGDEAAVEVTLFHDVFCSWCYIADQRLEYLRDEYGPVVRWRLKGFALRVEAELPDAKARSVNARAWRRLARQPEGKGVKPDLWKGSDPPVTSVPPLIALEAALPQGDAVQRKLLKAMRRAAFIDGINVARRDVILELAEGAGLDMDRFVTRFDDPRTEAAVDADMNDAENEGVKGVPAVVIGGEWLMQGCRDLAEYRHVIDKYLRERVAAAAPVRMIH